MKTEIYRDRPADIGEPGELRQLQSRIEKMRESINALSHDIYEFSANLIGPVPMKEGTNKIPIELHNGGVVHQISVVCEEIYDTIGRIQEEVNRLNRLF